MRWSHRTYATLHGLLAVSSLAGCGPESGVLEDLAELCGDAAPVHILPLEGHEVVSPDYGVARVGDRWLYAIRTFESPIENLHELSWPPEDRTVRQIDARVESIDRCGGDRRVVAEGIDVLLPPLEDGEPWLGYHDELHALYSFDPTARFTPRRLATIPYWTWLVVHGDTIFVHRTDHRDIVRITLERGGAETHTEVLVTDVAFTSSMHRWSNPSSIAVLRDDGDLVALDLSSGEAEVVREGVRVFAVSPDLRWVAWAPGDPAQPSNPLPREAWILDRETSEERLLAFDDDAGIVVQIQGEHLSAWRVDDVVSTTRFMWLPGALELELEGQWHQAGSLPGGAFAALGPGALGGFAVFAPVDGEIVSIVESIEGHSLWDDAIWSRDHAAYEHLDRPDDQRPYDLVRYPYPTFEPEVVEERVYSGVALEGDRWISVVDGSIETGVGNLRVIDGDTGATRVIDRSVAPFFERLEPHERDGLGYWRTDEIVYQVRDGGGSRGGLWRARFSP